MANSNKPQIHGHRGARGRYPENTLESVQFAIGSGADGAEVDLCVSQDDIVVVHHDLALSPDIAIAPDNHRIVAPIPLRSLTYREIERFDVGSIRPGSDYAARFPEQRAVPGSTVPTLEQFITLILEHAPDDFVFNLELKGDPYHPELIPSPRHYVSLVLDIVDRFPIAHRTFIQSFDWRLIKLVQRRSPGLLTGLLTDLQSPGHPHVPKVGHTDPWTDGWSLEDVDGSMPRMVASAGSPVWSSHHLDLSAELVQEAHDLGLKVYTYTVNQVEEMEKLLTWGVDVITTDFPDKMISALSK
ncbi:MAG: glycerophosphodiester phosphodiesterase family protein [bacterium]